MVLRDADIQELFHIGLGQIQLPLFAEGWGKNLAGPGKNLVKLAFHILPHLVTTGANGRTQSYFHLSGLGSIGFAHGQ